MRRLLAFVGLVTLVAPQAAAGDWLSLRSDHFEVVGNATERDLRNVALKLEQFRDAVSKLNPAILREGHTPPIVVLVFKNKSSYQPFMPLADGKVLPVAGLFVPADDVNYITLTLEDAGQGYGVVFHEFSHLLLRGVFADVPVWFNEGLAEYYSTFEVISSRRANIGKPSVSHLQLLRSRRLPFAHFFEIDRRSPEYTKETVDRHILYAQAWAIVHHAFHGEPKRENELLAFVKKMADGGATDASFRAAYGIDVSDLEKEIQEYVNRQAHAFMTYEFTEDLVRRITSRATKISDAEADARLGDLLVHMGREEEAMAHLEKALAAKHDLALAHSSLGTLQVRQGKTAEGMTHLKEAQSLGTANETAYFAYAYGLISQGDAAGLQDAARALKRAIELRPGYTEAKVLLGSAYLLSDDFAAARDLLMPVVRAEPANHRAALQLGYALVRLNDPTGARAVVGPVLARSTDAAERERARTLLEVSVAESEPRLNAIPTPVNPSSTRPEVGTKTPVALRGREFIPLFRTVGDGERRSYGVFEAVDCTPGGPVFVVRTSNGRLRARAVRFEDVEFIAYRTLAATSVNCGAQSPAMEVYLTWRPQTGAPERAEGSAVAIEVLPEGFVP